MKLKFCGLRRLEDMAMINQYPSDYIGFVFADSQRQVTISQVQVLMANLQVNSIQTVGVFANQSLTEVIQAVECLNLDVIQLHGHEDAAYLSLLKEKTGREIWKAIPSSREALENFSMIPADKVVIDSVRGGGSGMIANWQLIRHYENSFNKPYLLAGGLNQDNVEAAMAYLTPYGLDLSSGLEKNGQKDLSLIRNIYFKVKTSY